MPLIVSNKLKSSLVSLIPSLYSKFSSLKYLFTVALLEFGS